MMMMMMVTNCRVKRTEKRRKNARMPTVKLPQEIAQYEHVQ